MKLEIDKMDLYNILPERYRKGVARIKPNLVGSIILDARSEDEWRSYSQIQCFKSVCSYFEKAKLKDEWLRDKYEDWFKIKAGMITGWKLWKDNQWIRLKEKPEDGIYLPVLKSCASATKKEMSELVDRVIGYTEANLQADNFGTYSNKIYEILQEMEMNNQKKTEEWQKEQAIQKAIKKEFGGNDG